MPWIQDAFFYHIYPLGFCGAPEYNNYALSPVPRLQKIKSWIAHMKELGVNAVLFGPLFEAVSHGYDTVDHNLIDRRLGTTDTFMDLTEELHKHGIRVVVDGVFHHVGRDFWAFRDLVEKKRYSTYADWFVNVNFDQKSPYGDPFRYDGWEGHYNLIKLNLKNPAVKDYIFSAVNRWISQFAIDGIRLDVAYCLDADFLGELSVLCRNLKNDFWLMGEVIHGDYNRWANPAMLDSVTNYECYKGLFSSHNDVNYFEIAYSLNRQFGEEHGLYKNLLLYNFADNHDVSRVASLLKHPAYLYPLYTLLFTMPGIPSVYYGSEWGIEGKKQYGSDASLRPELDLAVVSQTSSNRDLIKTIQRLAKIRREHPALQTGKYQQILVKHQQFAFLRQTDKEAIIVVVNSDTRMVSLDIDIPLRGVSKLVDLINDGEEFSIHNQKSNISTYSCWTRILLVEIAS